MSEIRALAQCPALEADEGSVATRQEKRETDVSNQWLKDNPDDHLPCLHCWATAYRLPFSK